jgi:tetratricopeptide (TPR) repeat protein
MNKIILSLVFILTSTFNLFSQNELSSELNALVEKGQFKTADSLFQIYIQGRLINPQLYIDYSNILFNKSRKSLVNISSDTLKNNEKGFEITDTTGRIAGSLTELVTFDTVLTHKAINVLSNCLKKYEYRLDIRFGIAYMYQQIDDFDNQYKIIKEGITYCKNNSDKIRWIDDEKPEGPPLEFVANIVYDYSTEEYDKETPTGDEKYLKLSLLLTEQFPEHPMSFANIAFYYYNKKDWVNSLKYFNTANNAHPDNNTILYNLAENYIMLKDIESGKKYFNQIIQLNTNPDMVKYANKRLQELK